MIPYAQLPTHKPEEFLRTVGLSPEDFRVAPSRPHRSPRRSLASSHFLVRIHNENKHTMCRHVEAWRESGLNQANYCRQQGLNPKTFSAWARRALPIDKNTAGCRFRSSDAITTRCYR